jgi:phosphatidate cytidylyltransferase
MAFNLATFKTRALSAIIFAVIMLAGLFVNEWTFLLLFCIIHFGCWIEYQKLVEKIDPGYKQISAIHRYGIIIAGWGFMLWMTNGAYHLSDFKLNETGLYLFLISIIAIPVLEIAMKKFIAKNIFHSLFGLIYISLSFGLLVGIRNGIETGFGWIPSLEIGLKLVLAVITANWINDTMAYIVGSFIGKTPLSSISPKKTWEGTIGGFILAVIAGGLIFTKLYPATVIVIADVHWYIIIAIAAAAGTIGDLLESKLKRLAGVKDSGTMMPGHGGFLDRFDSLLIASIFAWIYIHFFVAA